MKGRTRRDFLKTSGAAAAGTLLATSCSSTPPEMAGESRPNLIFFFTDQHRRQAFGFMDEDPVWTPNIDRFASESRVFLNACSNFPVCSPFRGMLLTGKYPHSNHLIANCNSAYTRYGVYLRDEERCISDVLYDAGYNTGYIGKWHLDAPDAPDADHWSEGVWEAYTPPGPKRHSFEFWYSYGCRFDFLRPYFWVGNDPESKKTFIDQWEVEHEADVAIRYIRNREGEQRDPEKPFALFISPHPPHSPFDEVPQHYLQPYLDQPLERLLNRPNVDLTIDTGSTAAARKWVRHYFAAITGIDEQFQRILRCLDEEGLSDDTIVVLTSDHGEMMGSHDLMNKTVWYEESMGIPLMIRWPGRIHPGTETMPIGVPDLYPTLLGLMDLGNRVPSVVEGTDHSSVVLGQSPPSVNSAFYLRPSVTPGPYDGLRGIRTREFFLGVSRSEAGETYTLFDLEQDPYQLTNVAEISPAVVADLRRQLDPWLEITNDPWLKVRI